MMMNKVGPKAVGELVGKLLMAVLVWKLMAVLMWNRDYLLTRIVKILIRIDVLTTTFNTCYILCRRDCWCTEGS